jgi:hypothetical protein
VSSTPRVGYVDSCPLSFRGIGGAQVDRPWIDAAAKTWDEETKLAVNGVVRWPGAYFRVTTRRSQRVIAFDDLPVDHTTGVFPIAEDDPAYAYDHNGNAIVAQTTISRLPLDPKRSDKPSCTPGGPIGVLDDDVYLYNALDGEGRDAAAHELPDACAGHPGPSDSYHHHDIPSCILDRAPKGAATLVGYALDGYGIYVVKNRAGVMPTNVALDACHGTTSVVPWDGSDVSVYHYVATLEYPYTVGCFHGTPVQVPRRDPVPGPVPLPGGHAARGGAP